VIHRSLAMNTDRGFSDNEVPQFGSAAFIPAISPAAAKSFNIGTYWRPDSVKASITKSFANNK